MDSQEFEICESRCQIACKSVDSSEDCYDSCIYTVCSDAFTAEKDMELYWKRSVFVYIDCADDINLWIFCIQIVQR